MRVDRPIVGQAHRLPRDGGKLGDCIPTIGLAISAPKRGRRCACPTMGPVLPVIAVWLAAALASARAETLTLADCLRETAAHNPQIIEQQHAVEAATAERLTFRARALPTVTIGGDLGYLGEENTEIIRTTSRDPTTGQQTTAYQTNKRKATEIVIGTGEIAQPIFDAAIPASWRRGGIGVVAAQGNLYTVAATELNATRVLFYQTLYQQEVGAVLQRIDALLAGEVKTIDQLVTAGLTARQVLLATQVQRTNFSTGIVNTNGAFQNGLTNLLQNMGRELGPAGSPGASSTAGVRLAGLLDERALSFDAAAAARRALVDRPDIRGLRATIRLTTEDANITRAGYYPTVKLYVAGELLPQSFVQHTETNSVRQSDQNQTTEVRPGVRANWTIIDTGAVRGSVAALVAQRDAFAVALRSAESNLPSDLALIRSRMTDATEKIAALRMNINLAENTLTMIQGGLAQGLNSQLDFYDAENGVLTAREGLLAAELEMSLAHAEYDRLTGRYLRYTPEEFATAHPPAASK